MSCSPHGVPQGSPLSEAGGSVPGSFNLSFGFDFDAAALSEMEKMEKSLLCEPHVSAAESVTLSPVCRLNSEHNTSTPQLHSGICLFLNVSPTGALPVAVKDAAPKFKCRERISTPIEDINHVLVSPSAESPAFSPVNCVFDQKGGVDCGDQLSGHTSSIR